MWLWGSTSKISSTKTCRSSLTHSTSYSCQKRKFSVSLSGVTGVSVIRRLSDARVQRHSLQNALDRECVRRTPFTEFVQFTTSKQFRQQQQPQLIINVCISLSLSPPTTAARVNKDRENQKVSFFFLQVLFEVSFLQSGK